MGDKRKRLLELVEILGLPLTSEEAKDNISNLSDEDIESLVSTYEDILNYQDVVEESVKFADSKALEQAFDEYDKKLERADSDYLANLEELQEKEDIMNEETEKTSSDQIMSTLNNLDSQLNDFESAHTELNSKLEQGYSANPPVTT